MFVLLDSVKLNDESDDEQFVSEVFLSAIKFSMQKADAFSDRIIFGLNQREKSKI